MGVQGAAIATLVSQLLNFLLIYWALWSASEGMAVILWWTLHFERITLRAYGA